MLGSQPQSDLRVTISWNTDATDVDLWVLEPDGTKCFYQHRQTASGGELSEDQTQGYGPERYQIRQAQPGVYTIIVHYFRANPNLLAGESHVQVAVTRHAGTSQETVERHTVILKRQDEQVEVCKVKF
jgi:Ca-activated chloride channel homolog